MVIIHLRSWIHRIPIGSRFCGDAMGYSRAEKAKTHERIVSLAAKKFREKGLTGIGIA